MSTVALVIFLKNSHIVLVNCVTTIFIEGGYVIPVRPRYKIIRDGAVVVEDDRIVFVGKLDEAKRKYHSDIVIKARRHVIVPGFVNAHCHLFQSILKNIGIDMELVSWLRTSIHPTLTSFHDEDFYIAAKWGLIENIKSGVTSIIENHYGPRGHEDVIKALIESRMRAVLARGIYEVNVLIDILKETPEQALSHVESLVKKYHGYNGRLMIAVAPMHPYNASVELLLKAKELSDKYNLIYHTHTAESKKDQELVIQLHGKSDVKLLYELGILGPKYHAVHAVNVSPEEIKYIAETGAHVIHNPESNMYLGSGIAPIPEYLSEGVNVALGTDGAGSNNNNDMIEAMRFAVLLHRAARSHPSIITAWDALEMATINGAKALGLEREIGSLEPGKKADITIIKLDAPHTTPVHDPLGAIVYCANEQDVDTVIVNGDILMLERQVLVFDEEKVKDEARKTAEKILDRAREEFNIKFPFEKYIE